MIYFRAVVLLVQVLSVLADGDASSEGDPGEPAESVLLGENVAAVGAEHSDVLQEEEEDDSVFFDYDEGQGQNCDGEVQRLNNEVVEVFAAISGKTFIPDCAEIRIAQKYAEGRSFHINNRTHLLLIDKDVKDLGDVEGIKREFEPGLQKELEQVGLDKADHEIPFGCASGKNGLVCYYRRLEVKLVRMGSLGEEYEDAFKTESGREVRDSVPGGQQDSEEDMLEQ